MKTSSGLIHLTEYETNYFPAAFFEEELAKIIWQQYSKYVTIEQPGWRNDNQWELTSSGWVGYIPIQDEITLCLNPKVSIGNLFRMLEYAYRLNLIVVEGLYESETLDEFYESLAKILALRVLDRKKKGLYKKYIDRREELPYIRGRIQFQEMYRKPWIINIPIQYQEHTPDISDNQILNWTLFVIIRSGICGENSISIIRRAYRELQRIVEQYPYSPQDCINRFYDRLNEDYKPMHALCRFFLENSGPTITLGEHSMMPFLINMDKLFELFVAEWLRTNLPENYQLVSQEHIKFGTTGKIHFEIDLVISEIESGKVKYVLDTKYKAPDSPSSPDIHQIVAYGEAKNCKEAILIYPEKLKSPFNGLIGEINLRTLTFPIDGDLEDAGEKFVSELLFEQDVLLNKTF